MIVLAGSEFQYRRDVVGFEVWVVGEDFVARRTCGEQIEHVLYTDAKTANAGTAATDIGIHRDSVDRAHALILARILANPAGVRV